MDTGSLKTYLFKARTAIIWFWSSVPHRTEKWPFYKFILVKCMSLKVVFSLSTVALPTVLYLTKWVINHNLGFVWFFYFFLRIVLERRNKYFVSQEEFHKVPHHSAWGPVVLLPDSGLSLSLSDIPLPEGFLFCIRLAHIGLVTWILSWLTAGNVVWLLAANISYVWCETLCEKASPMFLPGRSTLQWKAIIYHGTWLWAQKSDFTQRLKWRQQMKTETDCGWKKKASF